MVLFSSASVVSTGALLMAARMQRHGVSADLADPNAGLWAVRGKPVKFEERWEMPVSELVAGFGAHEAFVTYLQGEMAVAYLSCVSTDGTLERWLVRKVTTTEIQALRQARASLRQVLDGPGLMVVSRTHRGGVSGAWRVSSLGQVPREAQPAGYDDWSVPGVPASAKHLATVQVLRYFSSAAGSVQLVSRADGTTHLLFNCGRVDKHTYRWLSVPCSNARFWLLEKGLISLRRALNQPDVQVLDRATEGTCLWAWDLQNGLKDIPARTVPLEVPARRINVH